jgi:AraC family transcriptional regulator of adaptative response/methylated-DNA-[protein]-cysteine methyltransferase
MEAGGAPPDWVSQLIRRLDSGSAARVSENDLRELGISPERARRWFKENYGTTFAAWCRGHRLSQAFTKLGEGTALDDVILDSGFESHSGFRDAFTQVFGAPPGRMRHGDAIIARVIESPLGPILAATRNRGLCLLSFVDARYFARDVRQLSQRHQAAVLPGEHRTLAQVETQLAEYFDGTRCEFEVPLDPEGTAFQMRVWKELVAIPYGATISYDELARRIGRPTAQRAVARANAVNRICILIPCHRVIGKDGTLTGYGGGLWRKRHLLAIEQQSRALSAAQR